MKYKIGIEQAPSKRGTNYPPPFDEPVMRIATEDLTRVSDETRRGVSVSPANERAAPAPRA
jgi:hypothetical protein